LQQRNDTHLKLAWLPGKLQSPNHSLTLVVKGCFDLVAGDKAVLCEDPDAGAIMVDMFVGDKPSASLRYVNDLVIYKPKADLTLSGVSYPEHGAVACRVTFAVGSWRKSLAIFNQRFWRWGKTSAPEPFGTGDTEQACHYENAFGNPILAANSAERTPLEGAYGDKWLKQDSPYFLANFDMSYFNTAPLDQQVAYLRGDESLYFENLRPEIPEFNSELPSLRPRLFVKGQMAGKPFFAEVTMRLDSLHVDIKALQVNLVWRGIVGVSSLEFEEISHACLYSEDMSDAPLSDSHYLALTEAALLEVESSFEREEAKLDVEPEQQNIEVPEFSCQMGKMFSDLSKQMKDAGAPDSLVNMIGQDMDSTAFMAKLAGYYDLDLDGAQHFID
jgi:hypothetical protein